jgi:hypothetical protein
MRNVGNSKPSAETRELLGEAARASVGVALDVTTGGAASAGLSLGGKLWQWTAEKVEHRRTEWVRAYLGADTTVDIDPAILDARLRAVGERPEIQALLLLAVRALDEVLAEAAVPALGRLVRDYEARGAGADAFFRGAKSLLCEVTDAELDDFGLIVREIVKAPLSTTHIHIATNALVPNRVKVRSGDAESNHRDHDHDLWDIDVGPYTSGLRFAELIEAHRLGAPSRSGGTLIDNDDLERRSWPFVVVVPIATLRRLQELLG